MTNVPEFTELDPLIAHGQEAYTPCFLRIYDNVVLKTFCTLVWGCPPRVVRRLYNECVGNRHIDIGPGTGYFVDHCTFPTARPEITLLDLNVNCLKFSAARLARYRPAVCRANLMGALPLPRDHFDSAGMNNVLHAIPGGWDRKGVVFGHVAEILRPGGTLFGTTVLDQGIPVSRLARRMLRVQHEQGTTFQNQGDDLAGLERQLAKYFPQYQVRVRGATAIFTATAGPLPHQDGGGES
jgi:SAM-dependent methyltransferase